MEDDSINQKFPKHVVRLYYTLTVGKTRDFCNNGTIQLSIIRNFSRIRINMSPISQESHISKKLLSNIQELPLWVKQVIYLELHKDLVEYFTNESLKSLTPEDTLAFYVPKVTAEGDQALLGMNDDIGKLLRDSKQGYTILDICLKHSLSLESCCSHVLEAIQSQWIHTPDSVKAMGTIEYMANNIRLGEYLVKMGRITKEQLEQALRTQQYIKEALQDHTGIANILINLGYITRQDTEGILFLKQESKKPLENLTLFKNFV